MPLPALSDAKLEDMTDAEMLPHRTVLLEALLDWCRTSGMLGLPRSTWFLEANEENDEEEEVLNEQAEEHADDWELRSKKHTLLAVSRKIWCRRLISEQKRATSKVGFLFLSYQVRRCEPI